MKNIFAAILSIILLAACSKKNLPAKSAEASVPITKPVVELTEALKSGRQLYISKCGNCHGLYGTEDRTARAWVPIIERMSVKAKLNEAEKISVLAYVQAFSKK